MEKPGWDEAPEWANYLVQDRKGVWVWFANEPEAVETEAYAYWRVGDDGGRSLVHDRPKENPGWKDTLELRPSRPVNAVGVPQA
ncbi:MAG: hypothetical protein [Caudoviricetes sp.]|nr:MAG: hypothetical protein [Caudoviricetes sp.]